MAFGKDNNAPVIRSAMNVRQQLRHGTRRPQQSGGNRGGSSLFYRDKYHPPEDGTVDTVRLIPGAYLLPEIDAENKDYVYDADGSVIHTEAPYFKFQQYYFHPKKRYMVGSEGPLGHFKGKGEPCLASDWFWYEWNKRKETGLENANTIRKTEMFAFSVLVQAPFYYVEQTDQHGVVQKNDAGKPYMEWRKGSKTGKDEYAAAGYEKTDGRVLHWPVNFHRYNYLLSYSDALATSCRSCSGEETIREIALICRGCGEAVVEMDTTNLSGIELNKFRNEPVTCTFCKHTGYLEDVIECAQCATPSPGTLFDFDLDLTLVVDPSGQNNQKNLQIQKARGPRPINAMYGEDMRKSLDLAKIYAPFSMEQQRSILGNIPEPAAEVTGDNARPPRQPVTGGTGGARGYSR